MITYRRPAPAEAETMAALHMQCWRETYQGILPEGLFQLMATQSRLESWQTYLAQMDLVVIAAYEHAQPIGFIIAANCDEKNFEGEDGQIDQLYLLAHFQRRGIGRRLIAEAAERWLQWGGHSLSLSVVVANKTARAFYEAMGARLVKTFLHEHEGYEVPNAIYVFENLKTLIP